MGSLEFRRIKAHGEFGKPERLFRAAVSAFCSLPRPTRREVQQLDDLTMPLIDSISAEGQRFAAAALSESRQAPPRLVRALAARPIDISAPLLVRSQALGDVDLIALIGRHGLDHAKAIARRGSLDPRIMDLIRVLGAAPAAPADPARPSATDAVRDRLRTFMTAPGDEMPATAAPGLADPQISRRRLRHAALTGMPPLFHTALADALDLSLEQASDIACREDPSDLLDAFAALDLPDAEAFLILSCVRPGLFESVETVRHFVQIYGELRPAAETIAVPANDARDGREAGAATPSRRLSG